MNILFVSPIFEVSSDPGSDRYFYNLKSLVNRGHKIRVITSSVIYKESRIRDDLRGRLFTKKNLEGIEVIYVWSYPKFRGSFINRFIYLFTYLVLAIIYGLFIDLPDVIYTTNSPVLIGYTGYLLSKLRKVPLIFEVADVWPDAGIAMGTLQSKFLISLLRRMEENCYQHARYITTLTNGIKKNIEEKGIEKEKIILLTNGVNPDLFENIDENIVSELRKKFSLENKFVLCYLGAHGHYNSLWTIIDAAIYFKEDRRFVFLFIGDGDYKRTLINKKEEFGLSNTIFLPPIPRKDCKNYLELADVFLLPNRKGEFFKMNLPNKLFDYMISKKPIIVSGEGETADVVRLAKAGLVVPAEDSVGLSNGIKELYSLPIDKREKMGNDAYNYVIENFDREKIVLGLEEILKSL